MKSITTLWLIILLAGKCAGQMSDIQILRNGFKRPPESAKPKIYWWWLNGAVDTVRLKEELVLMKQAGIGGVDIFEIGVFPDDNLENQVGTGPAFMGDDFLKSLKAALDKAGELGMEAGMSVASSWNAGGSWVRPEHAAKTLYSSSVKLGPSARREVKLPFPEISPNDPRGRSRLIVYDHHQRPAYYEEVAVLAIPASYEGPLDTARILNLTPFFNREKEVLNWAPDKGEWEIYRYICANSGEHLFLPSPNSVGPIIDHYDPEATAEHLRYFIDRLKPLVGGDFSKSALKYLYLASYEATDFAWSAKLPEQFRMLNGYDVYKFIPALFNGKKFAPEIMDAFRHDLRKTFSEMMIRHHYRKAKEICNANGLMVISEAGGPGVYNIPVETLKALGSLDIPRGEFWYKTEKFNKEGIDIMWLVKEIAAASHIYKQKMAEEEAFTSMKHWQEGPSDLKIIADRAFCEGMNRVVIHGFPHNPGVTGYPGIAYFAGTHYNDKRIWWSKVRPFHDYLARVSHILQESRFVADVLYYYGDDIPNLVPPKNTAFKVGHGFDYEIINTEVLLRDLEVEDGLWVLPGAGKYSILSIGENNRIGPGALKKLNTLRQKGGITTRLDFSDFLSRNTPDFSYPGQDQGLLDYIHFRHSAGSFYFVRNTTGQWVSENCAFRQTQLIPEIWDPVSGNIYTASASPVNGKQTEIGLKLPPFGAFFVFFPEEQGNRDRVAPPNRNSFPLFSEPFTSDTLRGSWSVAFDKGWGAPDSVSRESLYSWTKSDVPGIRYFSGNARYYKDFEAGHAKGRVYLDLGQLSKIGRAWLNGKDLGIVWTPPFRYDITYALRAGKNNLCIEIGNTWSNRLTGDAILKQQFTNTNIFFPNKGQRLTWDKIPLQESGLYGPVTLQFHHE